MAAFLDESTRRQSFRRQMLCPGLHAAKKGCYDVELKELVNCESNEIVIKDLVHVLSKRESVFSQGNKKKKQAKFIVSFAQTKAFFEKNGKNSFHHLVFNKVETFFRSESFCEEHPKRRRPKRTLSIMTTQT